MSTFAEGDKVIVKHQKEMGECVVVNPHEETDMVRVGTGEPVGFYVRIDTAKAKNQGYHEQNLEKV
jgi:hypothetical protein